MVVVHTHSSRFSRTWEVVTSPLREPVIRPTLKLCCEISAFMFHEALVSVASYCKREVPEVNDVLRSHTKIDTVADVHCVEYLDRLHKTLQDSDDVGGLLMRAVPAEFVAAEWNTLPALDVASSFWRTNAGDSRDYNKSAPCSQAHRFVSHCWTAPKDWHEAMGNHCHYAEIKATELATVAKDIAPEGIQWKRVAFWIDKCCIPQGHPVMAKCVLHLEDFIKRCDGMVVLFTWRCFERLWCVYERASFLVYHSASKVRLCAEAFLRPTTRSLFLSAIKAFNVKDAQCSVKADRAVLQAKVDENYHSNEAFETFARGTAIAVLAYSELRRSSRSKQEFAEQYVPWRNLAEELGMHEIAAALRAVDPVTWRRMASRIQSRSPSDTLKKTSKRWHEEYFSWVDVWFEEEVLPVLENLRVHCVRATHVQKVKLSPEEWFDRGWAIEV